MVVCPKCRKPYTGRPALSRVDNKTDICPDCGMREAIESMNQLDKLVVSVKIKKEETRWMRQKK